MVVNRPTAAAPKPTYTYSSKYRIQVAIYVKYNKARLLGMDEAKLHHFNSFARTRYLWSNEHMPVYSVQQVAE